MKSKKIKPKSAWSKEDTRRRQKAAEKFHSGKIRYDELEEVDNLRFPRLFLHTA